MSKHKAHRETVTVTSADVGTLPDGILDPQPVKTGIVEAVGVAVGRNRFDHASEAHGLQIETAMTNAVIACQAEGITDPAIIRERMLKARDQVL